MTENSPKVALLGRAGPAREHLRKALADLGGEITIEGEPGDLLPSQVAATEPSVVVVSLDSAMEDKLEDWDELFEAEGLNVIFDEAETTSQLDGWDLARWARHLAAKILGHDRTLPPVPDGSPPVQGAVDWIPSPGGPLTPAAQMDAERLEDYAVEALDLAGSVPVADDPQSDGADSADLQSWSDDVGAIEAEELELDEDLAALIAQHDANAAGDGAVRFGGPSDAPADTGVDAGEADAGIEFSIEFSGISDTVAVAGHGNEDSGELAAASQAWDIPAIDVQGLDLASDEGVLESQVSDVETAASDSGSPVALPTDGTKGDAQRFSFGRELELVLDGAEDTGDVEVPAEPAPVPAPAGGTTSGMSFDQLAAAFQLEDDDADDGDAVAEAHVAGGDVAARGVLVLMAGMGGPDALRQLLSALPPKIPVPVVVWQQLNAGTHDRLASQLAKTGKVETAVAQAGDSPKAGVVYILPPGVGLSGGADLRFVEEAGSPAGLLPALEPLGDDAVVVALSGADAAWLADSSKWTAKGGRLLAQSPATCFEASACDSLVKQGVADAPPADLAIRALSKWHEDI